MERPENEQNPEESENSEDEKNEEQQNQSGEDQKLEALQQHISKLEERLDHQSRIIGKYENEKKREEKNPEEKKEDTKPEGDKLSFSALEAKVQALEARNAAKLEAVKRSEMSSALVQNGVDSSFADDISGFVLYKHGDQIKAVEDDLGRVSVTVGEEATSLTDWTRGFLESDAGKAFSSRRKGPSVNNGGDSQGGNRRVGLNSTEYAKKMAEIQANRELTEEQKKDRAAGFKMI